MRWHESSWLKILGIISLSIISVFSGACTKRVIREKKLVTPLAVPLQKVNNNYGVLVGEYLIPETITIPGGQFIMGSEEEDGIEANEIPRHTVILDSFEMGRLEITNAQFAAFVTATGYKNQEWQSFNQPGRENYPARAISWVDAIAYCEWLSKITGRQYRLPTEAEWEYTAGGSQNVQFAWGNGWDKKAANVGKTQAEPSLVASFPPNNFGLYDMT
ncbi:MAG: SUMF1/EgtB/PvdO family nonheme iron enzyme, partial [Acidobacteriota bacterium]